MQSDDAPSERGMAAREQVMRYVASLEAELAGCDPALRHDAVIDAETHLRSAIDGGVPAERAIADFGTPQEIARAYIEHDSEAYGWRVHAPAPARPAARAASGGPSGGPPGGPASPTASSQPVSRMPAQRPSLASRIPVIGIWIDPRAWGALIYFGAVGFLLSIAYFVWSVTMGALVLGLAPLIIGVPLLVLLLGSARALCLFEGKVVEALLGVRMPRRVQPIEGADSVGFWQRILCWLRDVRSWLSLAYLLGNFFISVCTFALTISLCALSVSLVLASIGSLLGFPVMVVGDGGGESTVIQVLGWRLEPDADGVLQVPVGASISMVAIGLCLATATLWLMRGLGWVYGHVVQAIQVARPQAVGAMPRAMRP
jgi:uncharacterized membrane protein